MAWSWKGCGSAPGVHTQERCTMLPLHSRTLLFWKRVSCLFRSNFERGKDWLKGCWPQPGSLFVQSAWLKGLEIQHRERTSMATNCPASPEENPFLEQPVSYPKWFLALVAPRQCARLCKATVMSTPLSHSHVVIYILAFTLQSHLQTLVPS